MSTLTIIYTVTGVISIIIALVLANYARLTSQAKIIAEKKKLKEKYQDSDMLTDESIRQTILEEVREVVYSKQQSEEISNRISSIFGEVLNKRVNQSIAELNKKYETIIEQKNQTEEIAWKKYEKVLTDKKQTEAVIRSIAEGLIVVDPQGKVIMMNPTAERLLGVSKKDKIGNSLLDNLKEEQLVSLSKVMPDRDDREIELISRDDETKKTLRASSAVIEDENGKTVGMVSVLSDITKQKELDKLKANFVANVSHELRTPLISMEKSISLILSKAAGDLSANQEEFLSLAQRNLKRLGVLINDLLDLSKLEAGKMQLKLQHQSIEKIITEAIESLNSWGKAKAITLGKDIQEGLPEVVVDPDRIIQVLNNLIGNAIKFTPYNGNITVKAKLGKEKGEIEIGVQDTGIGIAKEDLAKVFDKFYQSGDRVSTDINGTGIGLSIAKEIVELHGGRIWAESEKERGAKFVFTLPLNSSAQ